MGLVTLIHGGGTELPAGELLDLLLLDLKGVAIVGIVREGRIQRRSPPYGRGEASGHLRMGGMASLS